MWSCLLQNALGQTRKIKELSNSTYTSRFVRLNCVRHANLNTKSIWVDMRSKKGDFFAGGVPNFILGFPLKRNILKISRRYIRIYQDISGYIYKYQCAIRWRDFKRSSFLASSSPGRRTRGSKCHRHHHHYHHHNNHHHHNHHHHSTHKKK